MGAADMNTAPLTAPIAGIVQHDPAQAAVDFHPAILVLEGYLQTAHPGALDCAIASAYEKTPEFMDRFGVSDAQSFLEFANSLLTWVPSEDIEAKTIYDILCMFYFILEQPPLSELQTPNHPNQAGQPLTWLSSWMVIYGQLIGQFMDTAASITPESYQSFVNVPKYCLEETVVPDGGFRTFNEFFGRRLKPGARPIDSPTDDRVIVYPADCKYDNSLQNQSIVEIQDSGIVHIKNLPWTIGSLLQGSEYADEFHGGVWMHAFLNTFNYHRQHAPVSGRVLEARTIQGTAYFEVNADCQAQEMKPRPENPNFPGYQFQQTRGLIIIDNPVVGKVAILPIGMATVCSVKLTVQEGDMVKKGDEISYFQFGGSDIVCVFQHKAGLTAEDFVASPEDTFSKTGTTLAISRPLNRASKL